MIKEKKRLLIVLEPGDLLLMCGSFQKYFVHKTVAGTLISGNLLQQYPGTSKDDANRLLRWLKKAWPSNRAVITWRRIVNHRLKPSCKTLPPTGNESDDLDVMLNEKIFLEKHYNAAKERSKKEENVRQNLVPLGTKRRRISATGSASSEGSRTPSIDALHVVDTSVEAVQQRLQRLLATNPRHITQIEESENFTADLHDLIVDAKEIMDCSNDDQKGRIMQLAKEMHSKFCIGNSQLLLLQMSEDAQKEMC